MPTFILPEYILKHLPERKRNDYGVMRSINGEGNKLLLFQNQRGKKLRKYSFSSVRNGIRRITPKNQTLYWLNLWCLLKQIGNIKSVIPKTPSYSGSLIRSHRVKGQDFCELSDCLSMFLQNMNPFFYILHILFL